LITWIMSGAFSIRRRKRSSLARKAMFACLRSVMSRATPTMRTTWPAAFRTGKARSRIQRTWPSGRTMRYSSS